MQEIEFEYEIGSNVVKVNNTIKYLDIIVWCEVTYEQIKSHIVK